MKALATALVLVMICAAVTACGGGGSPSATPQPDATDIDPNLLTAVSLQSSDLPPEFSGEVSFNPPSNQTAATGYSAAFRIDGLSITSNVVKYTDVAARDQELTRTRRAFAKVIGPESTYRVENSDAAYYYASAPQEAQASILLKGRYLVSVAFQGTVPSRAEAALNRAELDRLTGLVYGRLQSLLANPSAATAVVGAPTYDPQSAGGAPADVTATP